MRRRPRGVPMRQAQTTATTTAAAEKSTPSTKASEQSSAETKKSVLTTNTDARAILDELDQVDEEEKARTQNALNQQVLSGSVDWLQYLIPPDTRDIKACQHTDEYNRTVYEHNNAQIPKVNELLRKIGYPETRCNPPTQYARAARQEYEKMLFHEDYRLLQAIKFLAERHIYPVRDYALTSDDDVKAVPIKADEIAKDEYIAEQVERIAKAREEADAAGDIDAVAKIGVDISAAVGPSHSMNCTCLNRWDGVSERCYGQAVRIKWITSKGHHFLRPVVIPMKY